LPWNEGCGGCSAGQVDPLIQVDQTDVSLVDLVHPSCVGGRGGVLDPRRATGQVRPHLLGRPHLQVWLCLVVRPCLARVAHWFQFCSKYVPTHKNKNTTRGTLLVPKICMKLVVYSSRTRGFDGQIFVVRTFNMFLDL
jgi:hypothetical protein